MTATCLSLNYSGRSTPEIGRAVIHRTAPRTAQEGLWFVGGSFANCRTYSRYVAMQIKAIEEGLLAKR